MLTKVVVKSGNETVALHPQKRYGRTYHMGTVVLANVAVWSTKEGTVVAGTVLHEAVEQDAPTHKVRGRMERYKASMGYVERNGAYIVGDQVFIAKDMSEKKDD